MPAEEGFDPLGSRLSDEAELYAHGHCHILARVLSSMTGWPINAALVEDTNTGKNCLVHAWVEMPDGLALDAHGVTNPADLLKMYSEGDMAEVFVLSHASVMRLGNGMKQMSQKQLKEAELFASKLMVEIAINDSQDDGFPQRE